jgi:hypothetical protein
MAAVVPLGTRGQALLPKDDFEAPGATVNTVIWPYTAGTRVESVEPFFGAPNRYLRVGGGGVKVLSASHAQDLAGQASTFAFDFYEPAASGNAVILGYAAGTSDINAAGAFVRLAVGDGTIAINDTEGTVLTQTGITNYPLDTRLTLSLALNHSATNQPFQGTNLPSRTLDVWYYNWANQQTVYALSIDVSESTRSPVTVGFRT